MRWGTLYKDEYQKSKWTIECRIFISFIWSQSELWNRNNNNVFTKKRKLAWLDFVDYTKLVSISLHAIEAFSYDNGWIYWQTLITFKVAILHQTFGFETLLMMDSTLYGFFRISSSTLTQSFYNRMGLFFSIWKFLSQTKPYNFIYEAIVFN